MVHALKRVPLHRANQREEEGAVAIVVALMMIVLVMCAALVVDLGNAKDVRRQSQNASDASALAAANVLYPTSNTCKPATPTQTPPCINDAVAAAKSYALANFDVTASAWDTCSDSGKLDNVPSGGTQCISFDSAYTTVRVKAPTKAVSTFFGGATGKQTIPVGSVAQAKLGRTVKCSLCFLGGVDAGNGDFSVVGGSIAVNGSVSAGPNSNWTASTNGVVGSVSGGNFAPAATSIPSFGDPLATSLTLPLSTAGLTSKSDPCNDGPGLYGDADIPKDTCTLKPGLYVISGTWGMKNNSLLAGTGVTLYVRSPSGYLDFKNGDVAISAPTSGSLADLAIVYDRNNTKNVGLQGNGNTSITGIVYAPSSSLDFNGNSCFGFKGGPVIVNSVVKANGNKSCVTITNPVDTTVVRTRQYLNR